MNADQEEHQWNLACSTVGGLMLVASALDDQLNDICISLLALGASPMLKPLVASLDSSRKVEILKAYAGTLTKGATWKGGLKKHVKAVEKVNSMRNIAAHSVLRFENGNAVLRSYAAAKLFKSIDLATKTAKTVELKDLAEAAKQGSEALLGSGLVLLENIARL